MFRKSFIAFFSAIAILGVAACTTTTGVRPADNISSQFVPGVSTLNDVEAALGQPLSVVTNADGSTSAKFHYGEAHIDAMSLLVGTVKGQDIITLVNFDKRGKYVSLSRETDNRTSN